MRRPRKPVGKEERVVADRDKAKKKTFDRAVNLLTFKPRSSSELRSRLLEKAWTDEEIVDEVIARLSAYGYLNDKEFALNTAAALLRRKPIGKYRLRQDLKRRKLDDEFIELALERAYDSMPEEDVIDRAIEKRVRTKGIPENRNERKKLFDHLARLGFSYDLIRSRIDDLSRASSTDS